MEMTDAKVVEKKIYEDGKKEYASKGLAGTALGIGIGGLALALLNGNGVARLDQHFDDAYGVKVADVGHLDVYGCHGLALLTKGCGGSPPAPDPNRR